MARFVSGKTGSRKTNACRALDALGVTYDIVSYVFDESDLSASTVASKVGLPAEQVFKTLCVRADDGAVVLAVLPGDRELDLKVAARLAGKKSVHPVRVSELMGLTGYIRGGVTALSCRKPYPVFLDDSARRHAVISVSAGQRGLQLFVAPDDYARATAATWGALTRG